MTAVWIRRWESRSPGTTPGRLRMSGDVRRVASPNSDLGTYTFPPQENPAVYVCGPTGFVETVARALVELGHPPQRVKTQRFGGT
jgi:ferredoxin-NADP reductase